MEQLSWSPERCQRLLAPFLCPVEGRYYLWEQLRPGGRQISFAEAQEYLERQGGSVLCLGEGFDGIVLKAGGPELARLAKKEWFEDDILFEQGRYATDHILPEDVYLLDEAGSWLLVLTHETTDWESEWNDWQKAAESRYCQLIER